MATISLTVNGAPHTVRAEPRTLLVELLRERLRLTGTSVAEEVVSPGELRSSPEASAEYLAHLVSVMARRAVRACL
jgi:hypothetical protein